MAQQVIYGIGGYDASKPNNNIIEIIEFDDDSAAVEVTPAQ